MAQTQHSGPLWTSLRRGPDDSRPPAALVVSILFAALLGWVGTIEVAGMPSAVAVVGCVVLAAAASWWLTVPAALASAAVSFLVIDGFVLGRAGDLGWNGAPDALLLVVLLLACLAGPEARREVEAARTTGNGINEP